MQSRPWIDGESSREQIRASRAKPIAESIGAKRGAEAGFCGASLRAAAAGRLCKADRGKEDAANRPPGPAKADGTNWIAGQTTSMSVLVRLRVNYRAGLVKYPG